MRRVFGSLGELLEYEREERGLTQEGFRRAMEGEGLNVSSTSYSKYVSGRGRITPEKLEALMDFLDVGGDEQRERLYRLALAPEGVKARPFERAS